MGNSCVNPEEGEGGTILISEGIAIPAEGTASTEGWKQSVVGSFGGTARG